MVFSRVIKPTAVVTNRGHALWQCADSSDKSSPTTLYFFLWMQHFYWKWGYEYRQFLKYYFMIQLWHKNRKFFLLLWFLSAFTMKYILCWLRQKFFLFPFSFLLLFLFSLTKKQTKKLRKRCSEEWNTSQLNNYFWWCRMKLPSGTPNWWWLAVFG